MTTIIDKSLSPAQQVDTWNLLYWHGQYRPIPKNILCVKGVILRHLAVNVWRQKRGLHPVGILFLGGGVN